MIKAEIVKDWTKENDYLRYSYGSRPNVAIIGEEHGKTDMIEQQELLLSKLKPKYLLHEGFEVCTYNPKTKKTGVLKNRCASEQDINQAFEGNEHVMAWSKKYNIPIVGCNNSLNEFDQFGNELSSKFQDKYEEEPPIGFFGGSETFLGDMQTRVIRTRSPLVAEDRNVKSYRDGVIGHAILEQATKTKKSLIAIIGADHMRPASSLHNILKNAKIDYICVDQTCKAK